MSIQWRRALDLTAALILLANIPLVLFFETQALLPSWMFPKLLHDLLKWHVHTNGDVFLLRSPPFYIGIVVGDIVIRVPLMLLNAYAFYYGRSWGHVAATLYGVHTTSSMIPMAFELYFMRASKRFRMVLVMMPQFLVAVYAMYRGLTVDTGLVVYGTPAAIPGVLSFLPRLWLWFPRFSFPGFSVSAPTLGVERQVVAEVVRDEAPRPSRSQRRGSRRQKESTALVQTAATSTEKAQVESSAPASARRPASPSTSARKLQTATTSTPKPAAAATASRHLQFPLSSLMQKFHWPFSSFASDAGSSGGVSHVELVSDDQPGSSRKPKLRAGRRLVKSKSRSRSRSRSKSKQREEEREGGDEDNNQEKSKTRRIALQDFINNATIVVRNSQ